MDDSVSVPVSLVNRMYRQGAVLKIHGHMIDRTLSSLDYDHMYGTVHYITLQYRVEGNSKI